MKIKISVLLLLLSVAGCGDISVSGCANKYLKAINLCDISHEDMSPEYFKCTKKAEKENDLCMAKVYGNKP